MPKKNKHALREYHLHIARTDAGFVWQIRYDRHAKPAIEAKQVFAMRNEAEQDGQRALAELKAKLSETP